MCVYECVCVFVRACVCTTDMHTHLEYELPHLTGTDHIQVCVCMNVCVYAGVYMYYSHTHII